MADVKTDLIVFACLSASQAGKNKIMFGLSTDIEGQCNAHCYIADDYGDNHATIRCQLPPNHKGMHREVSRDGKLIIEWEEDERAKSNPCSL